MIAVPLGSTARETQVLAFGARERSLWKMHRRPVPGCWFGGARGLMVRVSAAFGMALLVMYWTAHMDWPFIENTNNFIIDYHIVYATLCVYLIVYRAGHVWGLDAWAENLLFVEQRPSLRFLVA
jgi:hypothetical protein